MKDRNGSPKSVLGWVSATVTLIGLVLGVAALNATVQDWRETRASVDQLVAGADEALLVGDFRLARDGYDQATQLDPTSPDLRDGRMRMALSWLREMIGDLREGESYRGLTGALLPDLYNSLEGKSDQDRSIIWAHIGWANHLAQLDREALDMRVVAKMRIRKIYDRAAALDENNFYTPIFRAYLDLDGGAQVDVSAAAANFLAGLAIAERTHGTASEQYRWARKMQLLGALAPMAAGASGRIGYGSQGHDRGLLLLRAINSMRQMGEPLPEDNIVDQMLGFHRSRTNNDESFEMIMAALPVSEHRDTFEWLLASEMAGRWLAMEHNRPALLLVKATLVEDIDPEEALNLYREIYEFEWVRGFMAIRIEEGIARLSGEQPPRMVERLGRTYINDEVPVEGDVYGFHLDTLMNFDTGFEPENSQSAFEYFIDPLGAGSHGKERVLRDVRKARERILSEYRQFKRVVETEGYTLEYSAIKEIILSQNLLRAHRAVAVNTLRNGLYDPALAELDDARAICDKWIPSWLFELRTRTLSQRNARGDLDLAGENLQRFIEAKVAYGGALDWSELKSHPAYANLRKTPKYGELMRGR